MTKKITKIVLCFLFQGHSYIWESESDFMGSHWVLNSVGTCKNCGYKTKKQEVFGKRS